MSHPEVIEALFNAEARHVEIAQEILRAVKTAVAIRHTGKVQRRCVQTECRSIKFCASQNSSITHSLASGFMTGLSYLRCQQSVPVRSSPELAHPPDVRCVGQRRITQHINRMEADPRSESRCVDVFLRQSDLLQADPARLPRRFRHICSSLLPTYRYFRLYRTDLPAGWRIYAVTLH